jgi:hypothetical protein
VTNTSRIAPFVLILAAGAYGFSRVAPATPKPPAVGAQAAEPDAAPIYVWIQPASELPGWTPRDAQEVEQAFVAWNGIAPAVQFAFSDDSADAAVRVTWVDRLDETMTGQTRVARDGDGRVIDASVRLAMHHADGRRVDGASMRALAMHEVGHLLGLPHSADPASIMAPVVHVRALTRADSTALRETQLGEGRE